MHHRSLPPRWSYLAVPLFVLCACVTPQRDQNISHLNYGAPGIRCGPCAMPEPERHDGGDRTGQLCAVWGRGGRSQHQRLHGSTRMAAGSALGYWDHPTVVTTYISGTLMPAARSDDRFGWTAVLRLDPSGWHGCADGPFGTSRRRSLHGHHTCFHVSCPSAVSEARLALRNFYNITIRIANVAERLAVIVLWLCDKHGSSISPQFIARLHICNADMHKAAD